MSLDVSKVKIANLALQKLGAERITSLTQDHPNARSVNACYDLQLAIELSKHRWNFSKKRASLGPHGTAPAFDYDHAFLLPEDCLTFRKPARVSLDWSVELHEGYNAILTNEDDEIELVYHALVTDPTKYHPLFIEMLACKIAWHCCEEITQSNSKQDSMLRQYEMAKAAARKMNAFEQTQQFEPVDTWILARQGGQLVDETWRER
jgi:hypothetical protein